VAASGSDIAPEVGAPDDELEITPEMIEAGSRLIADFLWGGN